ncbi:hypothetical protein Val02_68910 [Virgisporangium aliadipatigenens]|uniref:Uncharacterized protein n=1 Tax=Virgisporangium aliadipatigenens TaxID=741659 RepID=A0A8J4DT86_9ACTN|nr:hypothetical protein [Virgisporangium aliadipatigenens]GIJ50005.1 hypothetical protein Val02_68910 [Virgisporangium aliadipatigenens]
MTSSARRRLIAEALSLGFRLVGTDGRTHIRMEHAVTGRCVSLPNSVPDHRPLIARYRAALRRAAGLSNQGRAAVDGQRRTRIHRSTPPAPMTALTDRQQAEIQARRVYVRRLRELREIASLMR